MAKNPKSFRMSDKATENLRWLVDASGANETAVIELALAHFRQSFVPSVPPGRQEIQPKREVSEFGIPEPEVPPVQWGGGESGQATQKRKRKRKRH